MTGAKEGTLVIVGTGIQLVNHLTYEASQHIQSAEKVLHVVNDHPTQKYIETLNPSAESLNHLYKAGRPRREIYLQMVDTIMGHLRSGLRVCAVFYGHPGVFVYPSHEAIRQARSEGYKALMLPGISAEDCLFADLGLDPGDFGCQSFEATDFLVHRRRFDTSSGLILWQIGVIGVRDYIADGRPSDQIGVLAEFLEEHYGSDHEVILYEASPLPYPIASPLIQRTTVSALPGAKISLMSTLYVPPTASKPDKAMMMRLGLSSQRPRPTGSGARKDGPKI